MVLWHHPKILISIFSSKFIFFLSILLIFCSFGNSFIHGYFLAVCVQFSFFLPILSLFFLQMIFSHLNLYYIFFHFFIFYYCIFFLQWEKSFKTKLHLKSMNLFFFEFKKKRKKCKNKNLKFFQPRNALVPQFSICKSSIVILNNNRWFISI